MQKINGKKVFQLLIMFLVVILLIPLASPSAQAQSTRRLVKGHFIPANEDHMIQGSFIIYEKGEQLFAGFSKDFKVTPGPDLRVVLRSSKNQAPMVILSSLVQNQGPQMYGVPVNFEMLKSFDQIVIYCARYHVDFGFATFEGVPLIRTNETLK